MYSLPVVVVAVVAVCNSQEQNSNAALQNNAQKYSLQDQAANMRDSAVNMVRQNMPNAGMGDAAAQMQNMANQVQQKLPSVGDAAAHVQNMAVQAQNKIPPLRKMAAGLQQSAFDLVRVRPKPSLLESPTCVADIQAICPEDKRKNNFDIMMCMQDRRVSCHDSFILFDTLHK